MLLDKLMTMSLRWVWNLNQNLVSNCISKWAWNKFWSSCTPLPTEFPCQMSKMNCRLFPFTHPTPLSLLTEITSLNTSCFVKKCHFSTAHLLFLWLVYFREMKMYLFSQKTYLQLPNSATCPSTSFKCIFKELEETAKLKKIRLTVFKNTCIDLLCNYILFSDN